MLCIRLLNEESPAAPLAAAVESLRAGRASTHVFAVNPVSFRQIPNAPFAYWVSERVRRLFTELSAFEEGKRMVRAGGQTSDDFRYLRTFWECPLKPHFGSWRTYVKGGAFSLFFDDPVLVAHWNDARNTFAGFLGRLGRSSEQPNNSELYFRPGITWPLRAKSFSPQFMPEACIFTVRGSAILAPKHDLPHLLGLVASSSFDYLYKLLLGRFGFPEFAAGVLQKLPTPLLDSVNRESLGGLALEGWSERRLLAAVDSTTHAFHLPALLMSSGLTLADRIDDWNARVARGEAAIALVKTRIDDIAFNLFGFDSADKATVTAQSTKEPDVAWEIETLTPDDDKSVEEEIATAVAGGTFVSELVDYALGAVLGRWDVRYAAAQATAPAEPSPFDALPVCSPGMLQNSAGHPASPADVPAGYPLRIAWAGVLVDDPHHAEDIEGRVREVFSFVFTSRVDAIADEAFALLGAVSLRDYLRTSDGFFAAHFSRHKKSGRQAPLYWTLSSPKGLYSIWLYYHRLTADTFFTVLREFVQPKLEDEERHVFRLRQEAGPTPAPAQTRDIAAADALVEDLRAFRDELQRIAPLWRPDLNDGVIINHAPLWRVTPHAQWRRALKDTWDALVAGKYDWAHLALHLWPERVIPKCAEDRSLAIAHNLEPLFWTEDKKTGKWLPNKRTDAELDKLVSDRTSPAVKAALESLLIAPSPTGTAKKSTRRAAKP